MNLRASQNPPGHQWHRQQEHHYRCGWKQTSSWRGDHRRSGSHCVLDERRQCERGDSILTIHLIHTQTQCQIFPTFVRQSEHPAVSHRTAQKKNKTWTRVGRLNNFVIVAAVPSSCNTVLLNNILSVVFCLYRSGPAVCGRYCLRRREGSVWRRGRPWAALLLRGRRKETRAITPSPWITLLEKTRLNSLSKLWVSDFFSSRFSSFFHFSFSFILLLPCYFSWLAESFGDLDLWTEIDKCSENIVTL